MTRPTETGSPYIPSGKFASKHDLEAAREKLVVRIDDLEVELSQVRADLDALTERVKPEKKK